MLKTITSHYQELQPASMNKPLIFFFFSKRDRDIPGYANHGGYNRWGHVQK
jgi:hypothetical protein